jgi:DNA polymerase III sliding clamp (beta) subunit (PCNA family)
MKYPDYRRMLSMQIGTVLLLDRAECKIILDVVKAANKDRAKYILVKDDSVVNVSGRGIAAIKGAKGCISYKLASGAALKNDTICLHTGYFLDAIKQMDAENVKFSFSTDEMKVRVEDETDPKFLYFMQVMNPNEAA